MRPTRPDQFLSKFINFSEPLLHRSIRRSGNSRAVSRFLTLALFTLVASVFASTANAQEIMPNFANIPTDWVKDRYEPASFSNVGEYQGRTNVLGISIDSTTSSVNRGGQGATFYNTQGRKYTFTPLAGVGSRLSSDLYIPGSWANHANGAVRSDMWATLLNAGQGISAYPIIGFTNYGGTARLRIWDTTAGDWQDLPTPVNYNAWTRFTIELAADTSINYYVDGALVHTDSDSNDSVSFRDVIMQAYNFDDPALTHPPSTVIADYTAYWNNTATIVKVRPESMSGWSQLTAASGASYSFVSDTAAPLGYGGVRLNTSSTTASKLTLQRTASLLPIAQVNNMSYATKYVAGPVHAAVGYQIVVRLNGTTASTNKTTFAYEPYWNGTVATDGSWQTWDVSAGRFWSTQTRNFGSCQVQNGSGGPPFYTLQWIKDNCPNAIVEAIYLNVGTYNQDYQVLADSVRFNNVIYDMEPTAIRNVDDDGFASATNCNATGAANAAFTNIADAVAAANPGDTIRVCPGTYTENLTISKPDLILVGANSGISAGPNPGTRVAESIINGRILSNVPITVSGFLFSGYQMTSNTDYLLRAQGTAGSTVIANNIFDGGIGNSTGRPVFLNTSGVNYHVHNNAVRNSFQGIMLEGGGNPGHLVEANLITNASSTGIIMMGSLSNGHTIRGNTVQSSGSGMVIAQGGHTITQNTFQNLNGSGIYLEATVRTFNNQITNNTINTVGTGVYFNGSNAAAVNNVLSGNSITATTGNRVVNLNADPLNATGNWWGSADETLLSGIMVGQVDYSSILGVGTDTDPSTGFQGDFSELTVHSLGADATSAGRIPRAIELLANVGSLFIRSGTYNGDIDASGKSVTISPGLSPGQVIVNGDMLLDNSDTLIIEINGPNPTFQFDNFIVNGSVTLGGATLDVSTGGGISGGSTFTLINNDGSDAVNGQFAGLPEGSTFTANGTTFSISYVGGSGNDVVLTAATVTCNTITIPTGISTVRNQFVSVPLNVNDTTGRGIISADFTLTYDPAVLTFHSVQSVGTLSNGKTITINNNPVTGTLIVSIFGPTPLTGIGSLINAQFTAIGPIGSTSHVDLSAFMFNGGVPCNQTSNGSVNIISSSVTGRVIYANSLIEKPVPYTTIGAVGSVNLSGVTDLSGNYSLSGFGPGSYVVTPSKTGDVNGINSFDAAMIAQHVVGLITLTSAQQSASDVSNDNFINSFDAALLSQWIVLIPNPGITGTWKFIPDHRDYANVETAQVAQNYSAILMGDVNGDWIAPSTFAGLYGQDYERQQRTHPVKDATTIELPNLVTGQGASISIPLTIKNMQQKDLISYQFDLLFDPNVIEPEQIAADLADTVSSHLTVVSNSPEPGLLKVVVYGVMPINKEGVMINLKFNVIGSGGQKSGLILRDLFLNEGSYPVNMTKGQIVISGDTGSRSAPRTTK